MKVKTDVLLKRLQQENTLADFLRHNESELTVPAFSHQIMQLCAIRNIPPERIICKANIERSYGHQIFKGRRHPSRDTVIQLAFGFECSVNETQALLKTAEASALYPRVKRDAVIMFCLNKRIGFIDAQIMLSDLGLPLLGNCPD